VPEAALHGVQLVLNRSLTQQYEVAGHNALFFDFGSYRHEHHNKMGDRYYAEIAIIILGKMAKSDVIRSKTFARKCYNMDYLYRTEYTSTGMARTRHGIPVSNRRTFTPSASPRRAIIN